MSAIQEQHDDVAMYIVTLTNIMQMKQSCLYVYATAVHNVTVLTMQTMQSQTCRS